jgi:hypothetical protein
MNYLKKELLLAEIEMRSIIQVCVAFSGFKMLQMYRCIYTSRQAPRDALSSEKENIRRDEKANYPVPLLHFLHPSCFVYPSGKHLKKLVRLKLYINGMAYTFSYTRKKF